MNKRHMHFTSELKTRSDDVEGEAYIEGYFVVYNQETELWPGAFEEIAPEALLNSLRGKDIICLDNHNTSAVLASVMSDTLELKSDSYGLYGKAKIDLEDPIAKSAYRKIQTGKVRGCSFGFYPIKEELVSRDDGTVKYRVTEAELLEVTTTVFPAYSQTEISARRKDIDSIKKQKLEHRKKQLKEMVNK